MHEQNLNSTKICLKKKDASDPDLRNTESVSRTRCGHIRPDTVQHQKELGARHASTRSEEFILVFSSWAEGHLPSVHIESVSFQLWCCRGNIAGCGGEKTHFIPQAGTFQLYSSQNNETKDLHTKTAVLCSLKNLKVTTYFIVYSSCVLSEAHCTFKIRLCTFYWIRWPWILP